LIGIYKLLRIKRRTYYGFRSITLPIGRILIFAIRTRCTYIIILLCPVVVIPVIRYRAVCPHTRSSGNGSLQDVVIQQNNIVQQVFTDNEGFLSVYCTRHIVLTCAYYYYIFSVFEICHSRTFHRYVVQRGQIFLHRYLCRQPP